MRGACTPSNQYFCICWVNTFSFLNGKEKKKALLFVCESNKQALIVRSGAPNLLGFVRQPSPDHGSSEQQKGVLAPSGGSG